jgi:hypothetical protein
METTPRPSRVVCSKGDQTVSDTPDFYLEVVFEFCIGQIVYFKGSANNATSTPRKFVVYEQIAQRCHGGIQRQYRLCDWNEFVPEVVLTCECPPYEWADPQRTLEELDVTRRRREQDLSSWSESAALKRYAKKAAGDEQEPKGENLT